MVFGLVGRDAQGLQMAINVIAAFLPAAIIGLLLEKPIKKYLFGGEAWGLWPIVAAWFFGGVAILVGELVAVLASDEDSPIGT